MIARALVLAAALAGAGGAAHAQSRRYPPEPVDRDAETAARSTLWEAASNPQRTPYELRIATAERGLGQRTPDAAREAIAELGPAIALLPDDPRAYRLRGELSASVQDWAGCARDLRAAWARDRAAPLEPRPATALRLRLGVCQARAGLLADAERTLAETAASGAGGGELWMRLGEVRIALGKLEEAIAALETAADASDAPQALVRWLLMGAFDRARRPADAVEAARLAMIYDRPLQVLSAINPSVPLLGTGEAEYLLGLAYGVSEAPRPEYALAYFRRFVALAPDSPWRKRAEDHLRELQRSSLPEVVERRGGNAAFDPAAARAAVRRQIAGLRACAARTPATVYEVTITRTGPRSNANARERPRFYAPAEGVAVVPAVDPGAVTAADRDAALRCLDGLAARIALPAIKERDQWYRAAFYVVAP